ncbi:MAG TPA: hypothetical protein VLD37_04705 [Candidatus Bilamarchaeum sp.]|nr:hypothetical protein [Candidatus Bilamarchaeum sp.]
MAEDKPYRYNKEGKSPYLLIGLLLVLIIVAGGGLLYIISQRPHAEPPPVPNQTNVTPPKPNQTNVTPVCDDNCILSHAVQDKNLSGCQAIANGSLEQECYVQLSGSLLDACKLVNDTPKRDSCLKSYAKAGMDMALCDLLSSGISECKLSIDMCYGSQEPDLCNALKLSDPAKCMSETSCLLNYSLTKGDEAACGGIQNPVVSAACKSSVLNSDRCSDLAKPAERDYCYELFAIYTNDKYTCTQITTDSSYAIDCYSVFAIREQNYTVCDVFSLDERWACYINYSLGTGDLSACYKIDSLATTNRFKCAFEFAKEYGNPAACEAIDRLNSRDTCYQGSIIYSNENLDWHYCDDISNFEWMNKCYNEAAKKYNDVTLCDRINTPYAREACISAFAVNQTK